MIRSSICTRRLRSVRAFSRLCRRIGQVLRRHIFFPLKSLLILALYRVQILLRVFTWRFWRLHLRLLISLLYISITAGLAVYQVRAVQLEKQRFLYYPESWVTRAPVHEARQSADNSTDSSEARSVGGGSLSVLPIDIKLYRVREGDTLTGIAERFGMDLDTIASLNREWGSGVHLIQIGEAIKIPNQDGIFIGVDGDLDALCEEKGVPVEVVFAVNGVDRTQINPGVQLFFPGVQHTGIERSVITGSAFLRPVAGWLSSAFGYRRDPFTDVMHFHRGVDLAAPTGTTVRAALDGKVVVVGFDPVLGNYVVIRHQISYSTLYGHLSQIWVSRGATVTRGQRLGAVGNTGKSTGPHLHFEIRRRGVPINAWGLMTSRY
ncbi:MAG: peptidoglycan DD-metalloendopeptidase family protein [Spirochaetales bacterium]|nr:peptidoglycan DD-metalloendopeptidase family protein [Spirochaetales bacterium]